MVTVSDLDAKALEVLEAVYESGGEANTPEIKEYTGIQKSGIIHYRYEKLEDAGLIETRTGEPEGTKMPPTVASLTEKAEEEIRGGLFGGEGATMVERMDRLERQYRRAIETFKEVQRDFEKWRFDPESDEEVEAAEIVARIGELEEVAEQIEKRDEETESVAEIADTVDWAERVVDDHHSRLEELERKVLEMEAPEEPDVYDELEEEIGRLSENQQELAESFDRAWEEAKEAKEKAEEARKEARSSGATLPNKSFLTRLRWLLFGGAYGEEEG